MADLGGNCSFLGLSAMIVMILMIVPMTSFIVSLLWGILEKENMLVKRWGWHMVLAWVLCCTGIGAIVTLVAWVLLIVATFIKGEDCMFVPLLVMVSDKLVGITGGSV